MKDWYQLAREIEEEFQRERLEFVYHFDKDATLFMEFLDYLETEIIDWLNDTNQAGSTFQQIKNGKNPKEYSNEIKRAYKNACQILDQ